MASKSMARVVRPQRRLRLLGPLTLALLSAARASGEVGRAVDECVKQRLSGLHISFLANEGQTDPAVAYYAQTFAGTVFVTRDGQIVYSLPAKRDSDSPRGRRDGHCTGLNQLFVCRVRWTYFRRWIRAWTLGGGPGNLGARPGVWRPATRRGVC